MRKGSRDISIDRLPHNPLRSSRGEVGGKTARPLWQRPVRSAGAKDSRSPSPPPPQSRRDGERLRVPSWRVRAKTSAEQRNLPGLPRYQAALPTPFSSSFALIPRLFVPQNARRNHRRAEPRRAAHPSPPAKPPSPGPLRRGGERGRGPGRGGRTGGRLCLPGAAERRRWPRRAPPGTAGPHRAARGGRGRTAVAGGLWRVPTPASGIPGSPIPSQCRSGLAPSRRAEPRYLRPRGSRTAPRMSCTAPGESCPGGPVWLSLEVQPGDPASQPRRVPRCPRGSLSSPGESPHFAWDSRTTSVGSRTAPRVLFRVRGVPHAPGPRPWTTRGDLVAPLSLPQPPTRHHQTAALLPTTRGDRSPPGGVMLPRLSRGVGPDAASSSPWAAAGRASKFCVCRGSPQTELLGFYLPAFVQQRCQVPRR